MHKCVYTHREKDIHTNTHTLHTHTYIHTHIQHTHMHTHADTHIHGQSYACTPAYAYTL